MRKKLLMTYLVIIAITIIITVSLSYNKVHSYFQNQLESNVSIQIEMLEKILKLELDQGNLDFQQIAAAYGSLNERRITIIDQEGVVLGDSMADPSTLDNHKLRPEVKVALQGGRGLSMRYSESVKEYLYYFAIPIDHPSFKGVLRLSYPAVNIQNLLWDITNSFLLALFIGIILSIGTAYLITRRIIEPIDELTSTAKLISSGDLTRKAYVNSKDQIGELADSFNEMTYQLHKIIHENEQKNIELEAILKSMSVGLVAVDENYRIILCNEAFQDIMNIRHDLVGLLFYEATRNRQLFNVIEKSVEDDEYIEEEAKMLYNNQDTLFKISASPIKSKINRDQRTGALILIENISNLRKLENIRRDFVSNVTHELKTPLTSIKGFVEALKSGAIDEKPLAIRFLDIIDIETERLTMLIDDILSLSEIETMRVDSTTNEYDLTEIVNEIGDMLSTQIAEKNLDFQIKIQKDLPLFRCNRNRIKQLFINLIDNSVKYTEKGSVLVEIKESVDHQNVLIKVKDTGIGIEEQHIERLFERFYRVDKGRSRKQGGTGLGLSIVKHIVELYQGTIEVKSTYGEGTTMKIRLPYQQPTE